MEAFVMLNGHTFTDSIEARSVLILLRAVSESVRSSRYLVRATHLALYPCINLLQLEIPCRQLVSNATFLQVEVQSYSSLSTCDVLAQLLFELFDFACWGASV